MPKAWRRAKVIAQAKPGKDPSCHPAIILSHYSVSVSNCLSG